ncbi:hypothetical protein [Herbiconiux sp. YIM B11900]|uniref:hypothetical protein n=1 Tax=Herbiconiux sp. YIM B11900 TaxID=3404131 RepID=UPI003F8363DC
MSSTETRSPFRSRGFIAAAVVVGIIVLAGIVVLVTSLTRGGDTAAPQTPAPSTSAPASTADPSVCGLPGDETTNTLDSAPDTTWELIGTLAAPADPEVSGPGTVDADGFRSCFAHTAEGALYAAANIFAMSTDSRLAPELSERYLLPGVGRDAVLAREAAGDYAPSSSTRAQIVGYKINAYDGAGATVDLVLQVANSGALVSIPTVLSWHDGDWKVVVDDSGNSPLDSAQVENLGGYTPWAGA